MITAAKKSGASAVKIQTYEADSMTINSDRKDFKIKHGMWKGQKLFDLYKSAQTLLLGMRDCSLMLKKKEF